MCLTPFSQFIPHCEKRNVTNAAVIASQCCWLFEAAMNIRPAGQYLIGLNQERFLTGPWAFCEKRIEVPWSFDKPHLEAGYWFLYYVCVCQCHFQTLTTFSSKFTHRSLDLIARMPEAKNAWCSWVSIWQKRTPPASRTRSLFPAPTLFPNKNVLREKLVPSINPTFNNMKMIQTS